VPVPEAVLKALAEPIIHHRTPEFEAILARVLKRLPHVFETREPAFLQASTGSGGMESALVNTLSPGDAVLAICAGKFGERWADIAEIYGMHVTRVEVAWGANLDLQVVRALLEQNPHIKAVLCQACETSTGAWLPVRELAALVAQSQALMMIDAITALGAVPMPMDEWNLDVVVGGSQKALMLPTGLSFLALSAKAWKMAEVARSPRFYWDLRTERQCNQKNQTYFSSPVSLICALDVVLEEMTETKGLRWFHRRTEQLAHATRAGAQILGLSLFPQTASPSLSCLRVPANIDSQKLRSYLEKNHRITIMGGQDDLTGKVIRIGHMGAIRDDDVLATIEALGQSLAHFAPGSIRPEQIQQAQQATRQALHA
jgi:aspartate aminotransferase-like enzyme